MTPAILMMNFKLPAKLLAATCFIACSSLSAPIVQYTTVGTFSTSGTASATFTNAGNTVSISFISATGSVNANPNSFVGFGNVIVTSTSTTPITLPSGLTLAITIVQTQPSMNTGQLTGTIAGALSGNSSSTVFTPASSTLTLGMVTYTLQNFYALVPPSSNNGDTSLQGSLTVTTTPEAGTFSMLFGGVLLAVGGSKKLRARFV